MSVDLSHMVKQPRGVLAWMLVLGAVLGSLAALSPQVSIAVLPMLVGAALLLRFPFLALLLATTSVLVPPVQLGGLGLGLDDIVPLLAAGFGAVYLLRKARREIWMGPYLVPFLFMMGSGMLAALAHQDGFRSMLELLLKGVVRHGISLTLVLVTYALTDTRRRREWLIRGLIAVAVAESLFGLLAFVFRYQGPYGIGLVDAPYLAASGIATRVVGTLSTPGPGGGSNFLGGYLALMIPLTIGATLAAEKWRGRFLGWATVALQLVCLTLTYTRASMACLMVGLLLMAAAYGKLRFVLKSIPFLVLAGLILLFLIPGLRGRITVDITERSYAWLTSLRVMIESPLVGVGPGRYLGLLDSWPADFWRGLGFFSPNMNPHNTFLFYGAEQGFAAMIGMLWLGALALRHSWQAWRQARWVGYRPDTMLALGLAVGLTVHLLNNLFASLIHLPSVGVYFWLACGLSWRLLSSARADKEVTP